MTKIVTTPLTMDTVKDLKCGDRVLLNGTIYTGRDAAHKRLFEMIQRGEELPFDLKGQVIYYVGPCPAKPGTVIGSAGPTTSGRMDPYTPLLLQSGLKGMIGKGLRSQAVVDAIIKYSAVYFAAIGGAGALLADSIKEAEVLAFPDLGPEAIYRLRVEDFPLTVIIDAEGNNLYTSGREKYRQK
ncbi:Fe-S-containing hydro-lyase [Thermoanaerobacterium sp. DL9XJH110]|uniref:Fe-S-containing hydro-lyase n=1 Tax=Thermoanaerobacterium sp. DL9XJH110 TaxID=3386643 RepID=UPI003BB565F0